jgi:hypothetical protein
MFPEKVAAFHHWVKCYAGFVVADYNMMNSRMKMFQIWLQKNAFIAYLNLSMA